MKVRPVFPFITMLLGAALFVAQLVSRLNLVTLVCLIYMMVMSVFMFIDALKKKKIYSGMLLGFVFVFAGVTLFHIFCGADAGFGAFSNALAGFASSEHKLLTGEGNFFTRLIGNILLGLPIIVAISGIFLFGKKKKENGGKVFYPLMSIVLAFLSVAYLLTMNLRTSPVTKRMWEGHDNYLASISEAKTDAPNVLIVLMDDLGYGDVSMNGAIYDTPSIDSIGENGLSFENFYSSYSVCSPARFACLTGRYPYRGYADNVLFPTISTFKPFAATRLFNSFEMGNNVDGMLGDEITLAETLRKAGYNTGAFGKWHLGDYGEYLPTNQGFDYFYGSHHVNDMTPYYFVRETGGEYEIVHGADELKDQSKLTEYIHNELENWLVETTTNSDNPFFIYYASPWPHAPLAVGEEFDGKTGMGTYVDCVTEFDAYLGKLFNKLEELGELENTIIIFSSDNGPALEGSVGELRGGKYLAYEGGQKVPFMIRWDKNNGLFKAGETRESAATLVDLYPTILDLCGIKTTSEENSNLPTDREIDGVSMMKLLKDDSVIHTEEVPILYMKREKLKSIQYAKPSSEVKKPSPDCDYEVLNKEYLNLKYFKNIQNDNSAFFDKYRKNWLHILNDDVGENYNRAKVYPELAAEMNEKMNEITAKFKNNRRGIIE
ncbi:MAG TPA: sulfatase-like hydrolase/transferase [Clostridiales bacterium]|nr:sulfatase-like hydrolase/transferase [Clostridiales bacterium]